MRQPFEPVALEHLGHHGRRLRPVWISSRAASHFFPGSFSPRWKQSVRSRWRSSADSSSPAAARPQLRDGRGQAQRGQNRVEAESHAVSGSESGGLNSLRSESSKWRVGESNRRAGESRTP